MHTVRPMQVVFYWVLCSFKERQLKRDYAYLHYLLLPLYRAENICEICSVLVRLLGKVFHASVMKKMIFLFFIDMLRVLWNTNFDLYLYRMGRSLNLSMYLFGEAKSGIVLFNLNILSASLTAI